MASGSSRCAIDTVVCNLIFACDVVVPAITIVIAILYTLFSKLNAFRVISLPPEHELDDEDTGILHQPIADNSSQDMANENTPLLSPHARTARLVPTWTSVALVAIAVTELGARIVLLLGRQTSRPFGYQGIDIIKIIIWLYAAIYPMVKPPRTAPYTLFLLYSSTLVAAIVSSFDPTGFAWTWDVKVASILHAAVCLLGGVLILRMPLQINKYEPRKDAEGLHPALDDYATLWQWLTYSWISPLIIQGKQGALNESDVWQLARDFRSRVLLRRFASIAPESEFMWRLFHANLGAILATGVLTMIAVTLGVVQPMILNKLLRAMEPDSSGVARAGRLQEILLWITLAAFSQMGRAIADTQKLYLARRVTLCAKSQATASIYEKTLRRIDTSGVVGTKNDNSANEGDPKTSGSEDSSADVGKITNLVTNDTNRINSFVTFWIMLCQTPLSIVLTASFLYHLMGWSAFAGYVTLLIAMPFNHFLMKWEYSALQGALKMRDARMTKMNELLQAIKFIKLSAWESKWYQRLLGQRENELALVRKHKWVMFGIHTLWDIVPISVACISLTTFTLVAKRELSVSIAFPALLTFEMLSQDITTIPMFINIAQRVYASLQRLGDYLDEEDVPAARNSTSLSEPLDSEERIGCEAAAFVWRTTAKADEGVKQDTRKTDSLSGLRTWLPVLGVPGPGVAPLQPASVTGSHSPSPSHYQFTLRDISVQFPIAKVSLITGPTGSGKSSLLSAMLGEMKCLHGLVHLPKFPNRIDHQTGLKMSVSFCAQHPWLQHQSIRDNILFGTPYNEQRYNDVLTACALVQDLAVLEDGDSTEIGEKGITLSGGQKARVALARAVYAYSKTVILDDVLSAVDTHTALHLVHRCLFGPIMRGRTVVLVTHHVQLVVDRCAFVVCMENGTIKAQGTASELRLSGSPEASPDLGPSHSDPKQIEPSNLQEPRGDTAPAKRLVEDEAKAIGAVKTTVYLTYVRAAGYSSLILLCFALVLQRCSDLGQKVWVKIWSDSYNHINLHLIPSLGFPRASQNPLPYIEIYISIQLVSAVGWLLIQLPDIIGSLRASRILFRRMLDSVLRSPIRLFDVTPSGRILNRFAKDIDSADEGLSHYYGGVLFNIVTLIVSVSVVTYGVPPFLIAAVLLGYLHYFIGQGYVRVSRDLNRLENTLRSPLVSAFGELLLGVSTVRAFSGEGRFLQAMFHRLDRTQAASYYNNMTNYWLRLRFSLLNTIMFVLSAVLSATLGLSAGLAAIVITQAESLYNTMYWGMFSYVDAEQAFNSIERIVEYIQLTPEPPRITNNRPAHDWPSRTGGIEFENVVIKYAPDLDAVLKSVSFQIRPGERIGLVGRTGSGKSTLALSLFRFIDPTLGKIIIDGVDITSIGVEDLRSRLTLIPQDAVLFKGTIRQNLDPFDDFTDAECLAALRSVHLSMDMASAVVDQSTESRDNGYSPETNIFVTLDSPVSEGGHNWSAGQRQLIAMARALLRKTRITVLDESTASVDHATDARIQATIRAGFNHGITIIIAHRLHTIIHCDRILVLDTGQVVEFDTPGNLLDRPGGVFRSMCEKSTEYQALYDAVHTV